MAEAEDEALIQAARGGDGEALDSLLKQYQPRIYRFGVKMCGDPEDARDVLQETLFAVARTVGGFRGESSVSTWLYTIARSFCIKKRRRSVFAPEVVSLEAEGAAARRAVDGGADPERILAERELATALEDAIGSLEPAYREVLLLRDVEGLPASEVAEVTGASVAAVKSRLHRARTAVRDRMAPLLSPSAAPAAGPGACPDVVGLLSRHLEGDIGPEACAEMERHVAACPGCGARCESLKETLRLCRAGAPPEVPAAVQESIRQGIRALLATRRA